MKWVYFFILGFAAAIPAFADPAQDMGKYLAAHGYGVVHVDNEERNAQIFNAEINGKRAAMILDTGCTFTTITRDCAQLAGLDVKKGTGTIYGVGGAIPGIFGIAVVRSLKLSDYEINRTTTIRIMPSEALFGGAARHFNRVDGLFGYDYLKLNAAILPVGADRFLFKPGAGPVPPLDSYMTTLGFKPIPLTHKEGELWITGVLEGQPISAVVDCGASVSLFDQDFVEKIAHDDVTPTSGHSRGLDGAWLDLGLFKAKELRMGPLDLGSCYIAATHSGQFKHSGMNALVGYDLLAAHQAIIDLGHDVLWMK